MISVLGVIAAGVGPALFWLWFVWRRDRYDREPKRLLASTFGFGALSTVLAALLEAATGAELDANPAGFAGAAIAAVFLVGPIEEGVKFAVVRFWAYPRPAFNEALDGPVYAAAAATGFAGLENIFYIAQHGPAVMIVRGPVSTLGHLLFVMPIGIALGRAKVGKARPGEVLGAYALAAVSHGLFDLFLIAPASGTAWGALFLLIIPLMVVMWRRMSSALTVAQRESRERALAVTCSYCGRRNVSEAPVAFCSYCGKPIAALAPGRPAAAPEPETLALREPPAPDLPRAEPAFPPTGLPARTHTARHPVGPAPAHAPALRYGGFPVRLAAWAIDSVLVLICQLGYTLLAAILWAIFAGESDLSTTSSDAPGSFLVWGMFGVVVLYHVATTAVLGGTLGKLILGYRVVRSDLARVGWGRATARYIAQSVSVMAFGLGYLWIIFDSRGRSWHDLIAGTVVVRGT